MNMLVNGASGYIGSYLVKDLLDAGHTVYAVCRRVHGFIENLNGTPGLEIIVCEQSELREKLAGKKVDVWYQLIWEGANGSLRADAEVQIRNELMAVQALELAAEIRCQKIIYAGTVYERMTQKILEEKKFSGNSFYVICKQHTHDVTWQLSKKYDIDYVWCQFCHPIGVGMNSNQLLPSAIRAFVCNDDIEFGKCDQPYDIFSAKDLAKAFRLLGENTNKKHFYYIGSGHPRILKEYIQEAADICHYDRKLEFGKRADDGMRYEWEWFDSSEFMEEFGAFVTEKYCNTIKRLICNYTC